MMAEATFLLLLKIEKFTTYIMGSCTDSPLMPYYEVVRVRQNIHFKFSMKVVTWKYSVFSMNITMRFKNWLELH